MSATSKHHETPLRPTRRRRGLRPVLVVALTFASIAAGMVFAPAASAQTELVRPASCTFTRSGDTATISYTPAANDGANRYVVQRNRNGLGWNWAARVWAGQPNIATNTVASDDGAQFRVLSRNVANELSDTRTCVEVGSLIPPSSCTFSRTGDIATINFDPAPNDGANRHILQRNRNGLGWFWAARTDVGEPTTETNEVSAADDVEFRMRSRNSADEWSAPQYCEEVEAAPLAPTSCTFTREGDTATIVYETAPNDGADRYVIERDVGNGWFWAARRLVGQPQFRTNTVAANVDVEYRIRSRNSAGLDSPRIPCVFSGGDGWVTQAQWNFSQTTGPIIDSVGNFDGEIGVGNHAGDMERRGGAARFSGRDGSIVVVPVDAASSSFNPAGAEMQWSAEFMLSPASITRLQDQTNPSWNLMQRGFANNTGGQWKTQIITRNNQAFVQCIVRDAAGNVISSRSLTPIDGWVRHRVTCEFNDVTNELTTTFDGATETVATADAGVTFGDVNPQGSTTCFTGANSLGDAVTIGNKPGCGTLDPTDRFIGSVFDAEVRKR